MFRFELFTVKSLALLMSVLLLALSVNSAVPTLMQTDMASSNSILQAMGQADQATPHASMDHTSMDHGSMQMAADEGCVSPGACCMDSCGQVGLTGAVINHSLPSSHFSTLPTRNKASRSLGAIYRPPRLTT